MIKAREKNAKNPTPRNLAPFVNAVIQGSQKPMVLELNQFKGYEDKKK